MMRVGLEAPLSHIRDFLPHTDILFLLYDSFHLLVAKDFKDFPEVEIWLDVPIHEGGIVPERVDAYWEVAHLVHADVVVLPDALWNSQETLRLAKKFLPLKEEFKVCGVIQGVGKDQVKYCYSELVELGVDFIGLPGWPDWGWYPLVDRFEIAQARFDLWMGIVNDGRYEKGIKHHLLGMKQPVELLWYKRWFNSFDTSLPIKLGKIGVTISQVVRGDVGKKDLTWILSEDEIKKSIENIQFLKLLGI